MVPDVGYACLMTDTDTFERRIILDGAVNFRDLGGYVAASGQAVTKWRQLFRADGLGELTEADFATLRDIGIRTVIDLRADYEVEKGHFDVEAHPVAYHHLPFLKSIPNAEEFDLTPDLLENQYLDMLDNAGEQIRTALEVLAGPDALPAVFHCTAGKDRTGLLSAIVLSLLGVSEETVVADYALSQEAMGRLKEKILRAYPDSEAMLSTIQGVFSAEPAKMRTLLSYLGEHYGTMARYVEGIGTAPGVVDALRAELLEPVSAL
jgi:protein-tyrosine phosphatase